MSGRLRPAVLVLLAAGALVAGMWLGGHPSRLPEPLRDAFVDKGVAVQAEALDTIAGDYFKSVKRKKLEDASIGAMVEALDDRFSHYFDPDTFKEFQEATEGEFSGVGMTVSGVERGLRVATVFEDAPAERAGIREGDVIVAVDGKSIAGKSADVATAKIKGPAGSKVRLTVERGERRRRRALRITRARIQVPVARGRLRQAGGKRVGHATLSSFTDGAHGQLRTEVEDLYDRGARGLVLDLRGNGGGLLNEAILVASVFVEKGVIVTTSGRSRSRRVFRATGGALRKRPMVVLVNGDSASAAEIVAASLEENGLATLVGTKTFGKGVFQEVIDLSNGGALDLTVGEYLTRRGRSLAGSGLRPEIRVRDRRDTESDEALERALEVLAAKLR